METERLTEQGLEKLFNDPRTKDEAARLVFGQDDGRRLCDIQARLRAMQRANAATSAQAPLPQPPGFATQRQPAQPSERKSDAGVGRQLDAGE